MDRRLKKLDRGALATLVGLVMAAAAAPLAAQDPPHWLSTSINIDCTSQCHVPHQAAGGALNLSASNVNLCQSCHQSTGLAGDLPIATADKAVPGADGIHHAFDACSQNPAAGAQPPLDQQMSLRLMGADAPCPQGYVVCSTCHNQHAAESALGGTHRISPGRQITALGTTGTLSSGGSFGGTQGVWYLVEISQAGNETNALFHYSKDNGTSWFPNATAGINVPLDSGVTVTFGAGSYVLGERWEFSASWPFLRAQLSVPAGAGSIMCRDCHRSFDMDHTAVETYDGNPKSHPVGVGLNANGRGYDRATPLDGDGGAPGSDGIPSNDLLLDGSSNVQCLTCHGVHYADSVTATP